MIRVKGLTERTLENAGTVNYTGNGLQFGRAASVATRIENVSTGVFNVTNEGDFRHNFSGSHAFNNAGTLNKSGLGTSEFTRFVAFNNTGSVNVDGGTLDISISVDFSGSQFLSN